MTQNEIQRLRDRLEAIYAEKEDIEALLSHQNADLTDEEDAEERCERLSEICELNDLLYEKIHDYAIDYYGEELGEIVDSIVCEWITADFETFCGGER